MNRLSLSDKDIIDPHLICKICGKKFKSISGLSTHITRCEDINTKKYYDLYLKKDSNEGICKFCGSPTRFRGLRGYNDYCSFACISRHPILKQKRKDTSLKNYGVDNPSKCHDIQLKKEQTSLKNHGVKCSLNNPLIKEKAIISCIEHYGVDNVFKADEIKQKIKDYYLDNFGVSANQLVPYIKQKSIETSLKHWGVPEPLQSEEVRLKGRNTASDKYNGIDHYFKTFEGREFLRFKRIKEIEDQVFHGEPMVPTIGKVERIVLDTLQKYVKFNIIRNTNKFRYIIGRFPDGYISELKLIILYDERHHFLNSDCTAYNEQSINEYENYKQLINHSIFRISEKEWQDEESVIMKFKEIILRMETK